MSILVFGAVPPLLVRRQHALLILGHLKLGKYQWVHGQLQ